MTNFQQQVMEDLHVSEKAIMVKKFIKELIHTQDDFDELVGELVARSEGSIFPALMRMKNRR